MHRRYRILVFLILPLIELALFGCSSPRSATISSSPASKSPLDSSSALTSAADGLEPLVRFEDVDTALTVEETITRRMEEARLHYRAALDAQAAGDSILSSQEFEQAIEILTEVGDYPEMDENEEYNDLTLSVIEDYERYIASIDELSPESSVFALREKLDQIVESIDISGMKIPTRIFKNVQISFVVNEHVERNVAFYLTKGREHFELWLYRSGKYFPHMRKVFEEEGIPEELVYLSMMESGLNPAARSWMRAVGLWQFMKGTGRLYGLDGDWWYDERRDFEKSTRAAAQYLRDLYEQYGDWYLAIAAYNSGAGRVNRAIRRSGSKDFWTLRRHLPRETRNFVPQYLAVAMMAMSPEEFGFQGITPAAALDFDVVTIDECVDLTVLARAAETDVETMRELNPELLQWCTPPGYRGYALRIPTGKGEIFASNYAQIPDNQKRDWLVHNVRRGETLSVISKKYGISMGLLMETNKIKNKHRLSVGQTIVIPVPAGSTRYASRIDTRESERRTLQPRSAPSAPPQKQDAFAGKAKLIYLVRAGDTIGHIADWYDVRASQIRMWNDIPYGSIIREGQLLFVWVPTNKRTYFERINDLSFEEKQNLTRSSIADQRVEGLESQTTHWVRYRVRSGDTLGKIAVLYDATIDDLKSWNGLRSSRIYAGQTLLIAVGEKESNGGVATKGGTNSERSYLLHKVRKGESLSTIARLYDVSVREIQDWNRLRSSRIYAGQELRIYTIRSSDRPRGAVPPSGTRNPTTF